MASSRQFVQVDGNVSFAVKLCNQIETHSPVFANDLIFCPKSLTLIFYTLSQMSGLQSQWISSFLRWNQMCPRPVSHQPSLRQSRNKNYPTVGKINQQLHLMAMALLKIPPHGKRMDIFIWVFCHALKTQYVLTDWLTRGLYKMGGLWWRGPR